MLPSKLIGDTAPCKCCESQASLFGVCDFNKNCEEHRGVHLPLSGIPIYYYRCPKCGFIFTRQFDLATEEEFKQRIYNDAYVTVDPDYAVIRPRANANTLAKQFAGSKESLRILDYGGGNGELAHSLREQGFNATTYDPFVPEFSARPGESFDLIVAFEVMEHVPEPLLTLRDMDSFLDKNGGLILFSTLLVPAEIEKVKMDWWYIAPRNGHISIFSQAGLGVLLRKCGLQLASASPGLHFGCRSVPNFATHLVRSG